MNFKQFNTLVHLLPILPKGKMRTRIARDAAARGDARALRAEPTDATVLARLGLHRMALSVARPNDWEALFLGHAAVGQVIPALAAVGKRKQVAAGTRLRGMRLLAVSNPQAALALSGSLFPVDRAAYALAANRPDLAERALEGESGREASMLRSALFATRFEWAKCRTHFACSFADDDLEVPVSPETEGPLRLDSLTTSVPARSAPGPKVSIVIPFHNAEQTLAMSVQSIIAQSWQDVEIILVDDRSCDNSEHIANALTKIDQRVRVISNDRKAGAAGARNTGIAASVGQFVMLHDADDWAHPRRVERQVGAARSGASVSMYVRIDADGRPMSPHIAPLVRLSPACLIVKRAAMIAVGPIEEVPFGSDSEFLARLDLKLGRRNVRREGSLLTVATWSETSISGDPAHGLATSQGREMREAYRADWLVRHASCILLTDEELNSGA
jgi:Glycosyl transferase family 2